MSEMFAALAAPFTPSQVSWRIGSTTADKKRGMALAYIDARDVMQRLDEACGAANWQCRYPHAGAKTVCEIGVRVNEEWIWRADGAGDSDVEAEKGALSDAFKRAAVRFGVGRYLYDMPSPWVEIEAHGKSYTIPDSEKARLAALLNRSAPPTPTRPQQPTALPAQPVASPPAPKDSSAEKEALDALRADLSGIATLSGMDTWRKRPESVERFAKLGIGARAAFQTEMANKRALIAPPNGAEG